MRLNGWQRLWLVVSVLYFVLVVALTVLFWPTEERTWHRDEFITSMPAELRAQVVAAYASEWSRQEALKAQELRRPPEQAKRMPKEKSAPPPPDLVPVSRLSFPNGAVLDVLVAKDGDSAPVAYAYMAVVESATRSARRTFTWTMLLVWLAPCLTLYALGWATGWVRRGFRGSAPSAR
jgi:hypothetical protein